MSVNLRYAINQDKVAHHGPYFGSIDFEVASTTKPILQQRGDDVHVGEFVINERKYKCSMRDLDDIVEGCREGNFSVRGNEYDLTDAELRRVEETCKLARQVFYSRFRFGK